jgi:hypothetical protein
MKSLTFLLVIASIGFLLSCDKENNSVITKPLPALSVEIPDSIAVGQECDYIIHGALPDPCCWYFRYSQLSNANSIEIKVFIKEDLNKICADVVVPIEIPGQLTLAERGIYNLHFWRSDTETLDRILIVY